MRDRAAHERHLQHPRQFDVAHEPPLPAQMAVILAPGHRAADTFVRR